MDRDSQDGLQLATAPESKGKYLGDPAVVSDLVRGFVAHILTLRSEWHAAEDDEKIDPTEEIGDLAQKLGDVFLGRHAGYVPQPFNAPHRLGVLMRHLVPTTEDPGRAFFDWLALQVVKAAIELELGAAEASVHQELESIVSDVIERLLGRTAVS